MGQLQSDLTNYTPIKISDTLILEKETAARGGDRFQGNCRETGDLFQACTNSGELGIEIRTDRGQCCDDHNRNQCSDETVFNGRRPTFIANKPNKSLLHIEPLSSAYDACRCDADIRNARGKVLSATQRDPMQINRIC